MKYIKCTSIDSEVFDAESDEEAMEKFKEIIKYDIEPAGGRPIKDYFVAKIVGYYAEWSLFPRKQFIVVSKEKMTQDKHTSRTQDETKKRITP